MTRPPSLPLPRLESLVDLFYRDARQLALFRKVETTSLPPVYAGLLAHREHMTVTVEAFHGCAVDVQVLEDRKEGSIYLRKILLRRQSDQSVVLFGLVRLKTEVLRSEVWQEIFDKKIPLGRVLINHNVMRVVRLADLWHVTCGQELSEYFGCQSDTITYGRTAMIDFDGQPALELLEIVAPVVSGSIGN